MVRQSRASFKAEAGTAFEILPEAVTKCATAIYRTKKFWRISWQSIFPKKLLYDAVAGAGFARLEGEISVASPRKPGGRSAMYGDISSGEETRGDFDPQGLNEPYTGWAMRSKFRVIKGGREDEDIYDRMEKAGGFDIDGELVGDEGVDPQYLDVWEWNYCNEYEQLVTIALLIIDQMTDDPFERDAAKLILKWGYDELETAKILLDWYNLKSLRESLARVKWFLRKVEGWSKTSQREEPEEEEDL